MDEAQQLAELSLGELLGLAVFAGLGIWALRLSGLIHPSPRSQRPPVQLQVWDAAAAFLSVLMVAPALATVLTFLIMRVLGQPSGEDPQLLAATRHWYPFLAIACQGLTLVAYLLITAKSPGRLWGGRARELGSSPLKESLHGAATWLLSIPSILFTSVIVSLLLLRFAGVQPLEQPVVQQLRQMASDPAQFLPRAVLISIFIPALEELLFRGIIHSWLRQSFSSGWTILLSSVLFAAVHYAPSIGWSNVEVLSSLFVLALFLGLLYERCHSLWAPAVLHGCFNLGTVLLILMTGA